MRIIFKGIVQGVGFRPTVYRTAKKMGLKGYVLNKGSEVEVLVDKKHEEFIKKLKHNLPSIAEIKEIELKKDDRVFNDFKIIKSKTGEKESLIPTDTATCKRCLKEMFDKNDRRYHFPFTNCTVCGARYSLIEDVPYDREKTAMKDFPLCKKCKNEYEDPFNRRYHAQTISCPDCGPQYHLYDEKGDKIDSDNIIKTFSSHIEKGSIGVIKSWGGMHICCKLELIKKLRKWYKRPQKPFAIMVKDLDTAKKFGKINDFQKKVLLSKSRPIILVEKKRSKNIAPGLNTIGIFLPYTGLHHLLFSYLDSEALIMTSANLPGEPMIIDNKKIFSLNADIYLLHNRKIPNRIDDSLLRTYKNKRFFIRKSRGHVPKPIKVEYKERILSVGPDENVTGSISSNNNIFTTQYIGNSRYYSTLKFLEESLTHLMNLTMEKPSLDAVGMDLHPGYDTRITAKKFSEEYGVKIFEVQHQWAHAASLMLENNVDESVALTLDGLGFGTDGNLWGGEVLRSDFNSFERAGHLSYLPLIGGDKASKDPRRIVFAIFDKLGEKKIFRGKKAEIFSKIIESSPLSSSMGRFLDAISCYLEICTKRTYSGEPAMKLEKYLSSGKNKYEFDVFVKNSVIDTIDLFKQLDGKSKKLELTEKQKSDLSYSLVKSVVEALTDIAINEAEDKNIKNIGITGGVSYNIPIVSIFRKRLENTDFNVLLHDRIPNGDGGISIGQNVIVGNKISKN
ncbi:MAG: carbamoyltransferase HypF [Candidatus Thermoplasmatota archaeon]